MRCSLVTFELIWVKVLVTCLKGVYIIAREPTRAREAFGATWEEALVSSLSVS